MLQAVPQRQELLDFAIECGASRAQWLCASTVVVEDRFAAMCRSPRCPSYGLAPGCPPHVMSPARFRRVLAGYECVLVFTRDVAAAMLAGNCRLEVAKNIHEIAAAVEVAAVSFGFSRAEGIAAGSCKELFCPEDQVCKVLQCDQPCRFPDKARPSVSGLGINVSALCAALGWQLSWQSHEGGEIVDMALMLGMVLTNPNFS